MHNTNHLSIFSVKLTHIVLRLYIPLVMSLLLCMLLLFTRESRSNNVISQSHHTVIPYGTWLINNDQTIELLNLGVDGSYLQIQFNLLHPQESFTEWGRVEALDQGYRFNPSYTNNPQQGLIAYNAKNQQSILVSLYQQQHHLIMAIDTNNDGVIEHYIEYQAYRSQTFYGLWQQSSADMNCLILLDNGYYGSIQISLSTDDLGIESHTGMEWGSFSADDRQFIMQPIFDNNLNQGFNHLTAISTPRVFYTYSKQQLALSFDHNGDNISDQNTVFLR